MNALESPLEVSLPLDYLRFGLLTTIVNNVWTWVAVITAAVSVWRIRSNSSPPSNHAPCQSSSIKKQAVSSTPVERLAAASNPEKVEEAPRSSPRAFDSEGRTSGQKFTFYYGREVEDDDEGVNVDEDGELDDVAGNVERNVKNSWEAMMEMRMADHMGFYRYQDLTVLDGSVVRLWDSCRRRNVINAAPMVRCADYDWSS